MTRHLHMIFLIHSLNLLLGSLTLGLPVGHLVINITNMAYVLYYFSFVSKITIGYLNLFQALHFNKRKFVLRDIYNKI